MIVVCFLACVGLLVGAMSWVTSTIFALERAEVATRREAALEENVRLALWRMDTALGLLVAREAARPISDYRPSVHTSDVPHTLPTGVGPDGAMQPSPLTTETGEHVLLHFQLEPDGTLTSPQVSAVGGNAAGSPASVAAKRLDELRRTITADQLLAALATDSSTIAPPEAPQPDVGAQQVRSQSERRARGSLNQIQQVQRPVRWRSEAAPSNTQGRMMPVWVDGKLLVLRRVASRGQTFIQGCWLDWPGIQEWLRGLVGDLLTGVDFEPVTREADRESPRSLATIPVRITPSSTLLDVPDARSTLEYSVAAVWIAGLIAVVAVGVLLVGTVRLSERRAAFVSAVTHEMRTPLTTFRIYTDSLRRNIVIDPAKRDRYIERLSVEAGRLSHLIENVLAYARLERRRPPHEGEAVGLSALVDRLQQPLADRAALAGLNFVVGLSEDASETSVTAAASVVEQIVGNLVDNACKYAASGDPPTVRLDIARQPGRVIFYVRDYGSGIERSRLHRIFRPFNKSSAQAAESAPGIGLGLALSRRLARDLGGDLALDDSWSDGASFALTLPVAR